MVCGWAAATSDPGAEWGSVGNAGDTGSLWGVHVVIRFLAGAFGFLSAAVTDGLATVGCDAGGGKPECPTTAAASTPDWGADHDGLNSAAVLATCDGDLGFEAMQPWIDISPS